MKVWLRCCDIFINNKMFLLQMNRDPMMGRGGEEEGKTESSDETVRKKRNAN
jgi:hypothetical protein